MNKIYIALEYGHEFTEILGVFAKEEDAEQLAKERADTILANWINLYGPDSNDPWPDYIERGPSDRTCVNEYDIQ
jgi:hypothetical protein